MAPPKATTPTPPRTKTPLGSGTPGNAVPAQLVGSELTLFLDIDFGILGNSGGKETAAMTAVHLPSLTPSDPLDLLIYFCGHKNGSVGNGPKLDNMSIDEYISQEPSFDLRKMIRGTSKRRFALVVPTLGNGSESGTMVTSGGNIDDFLGMVCRGVGAGLAAALGSANAATPKPGNIVLAAHSGGGEPLFRFVQNATAATKKAIREVWCFDCTYGHGQEWVGLLKGTAPGVTPPTPLLPGLVKLWVVSTGMTTVTKLALRDPKLKEDPVTNPKEPKCFNSGTGDQARVLLKYGRDSKATNIEVYHAGLTHCEGEGDLPKADYNFVGYKYPTGHNQSVGDGLPTLIDKSTVLK